MRDQTSWVNSYIGWGEKKFNIRPHTREYKPIEANAEWFEGRQVITYQETAKKPVYIVKPIEEKKQNFDFDDLFSEVDE